ncbi:hypothetical protein [Alishewanella sp. SMS8]|uniref:hypothetical protein n=1 Tax=Alishewanella sp. SMS8 TaxID=2994676 RepID=UPI002740A23B|nr:hypothetical protein [Alishewanella sp. SMS8]MDP5458720.1 hypothetical protein [Alishewanella sp. SMS8]
MNKVQINSSPLFLHKFSLNCPFQRKAISHCAANKPAYRCCVANPLSHWLIKADISLTPQQQALIGDYASLVKQWR